MNYTNSACIYVMCATNFIYRVLFPPTIMRGAYALNAIHLANGSLGLCYRHLGGRCGILTRCYFVVKDHSVGALGVW